MSSGKRTLVMSQPSDLLEGEESCEVSGREPKKKGTDEGEIKDQRIYTLEGIPRI